MNDRCLGGTRSSGRSGLSRLVYETIPLVVLVNGASMSAAEVVAGALQASGGALLIGSSSFGQGNGPTSYPARRWRGTLAYLILHAHAGRLSAAASQPRPRHLHSFVTGNSAGRASRPQPVGVQSFSRAGSDRPELAERLGLDRIAHGLPVFPSRGRGGEQDRQARSRTFCRATAMSGGPVGAIARQDATRYFHAGRTGETLFRSQPGERHSCIEIQVAGT
jgi:hypothetical protein